MFKINDAGVTPNTVTTGAAVKVSVSIRENTWKNIKDNFLTWKTVKDYFKSWFEVRDYM